jgi:hypothetical protein
MGRNLVHAGALGGLALLIGVGGAVVLRAVGPDHKVEQGEGGLESTIEVRRFDGQTEIIAPPAVLRSGVLAVEAVQPATRAQTRRGLATVLSLQPLFELRRAISTAQAEAKRAELAAQAAQLEVKRLTLLHADDRLVSDKALETAQVAAATEAASLANTKSQIALQASEARRQWGPVVGDWLIRDARPLQGLLSGRTVLVQLSGAETSVIPPTGAELVLPDGARLGVSVIGPAAQADPRFGQPGVYGLAAARPALAQGLSVPVELFGGPALQGVAVPDAAIVRQGGRAFVYVEHRPGVFIRTPVDGGVQAPGGWLIRQGLWSGARIVVHGAQLLLSQETKSAGGDGGE